MESKLKAGLLSLAPGKDAKNGASRKHIKLTCSVLLLLHQLEVHYTAKTILVALHYWLLSCLRSTSRTKSCRFIIVHRVLWETRIPTRHYTILNFRMSRKLTLKFIEISTAVSTLALQTEYLHRLEKHVSQHCSMIPSSPMPD